jgi:hypothetical protein
MLTKFILIGFLSVGLRFITQDLNEIIEPNDEIESPIPDEDDTSNLCKNYVNSTTTVCIRPSFISKIPS